MKLYCKTSGAFGHPAQNDNWDFVSGNFYEATKKSGRYSDFTKYDIIDKNGKSHIFTEGEIHFKLMFADEVETREILLDQLSE